MVVQYYNSVLLCFFCSDWLFDIWDRLESIIFIKYGFSYWRLLYWYWCLNKNQGPFLISLTWKSKYWHNHCCWRRDVTPKKEQQVCLTFSFSVELFITVLCSVTDQNSCKLWKKPLCGVMFYTLWIEWTPVMSVYGLQIYTWQLLRAKTL